MRQYDQIQKQLQNRKEALAHRMRQAGELNVRAPSASASFSTGELSQYDNHPADTATDLYEREKDLALYEQMEREYEEVSYALEKIEQGTYGMCEVTGKPIPLERLEANPTARTIVEYGNGRLPKHRPVEEEVLTGFEQFHYDDDDAETEFDAEDAYQAVARFNENDMTFEDASLDDEDELIGYVEELEAFVSTGIEGYRGAEHVDFQRNVHYDHYLNDSL
ncbi:TraR/DksA C4-type zinc finger protein [Halalkalibacterium ligniniphilum]|uniref:TraR/DksA C4-type zinc finger protein n=1 Tax=Halalkalibacterium ligniniphilum TaxID=1134413 RepID=UPI0003454279|nr:TraR/DksA C4-type zinc finger protein [Halalkalibacterium ligniniphilum]